MMSLLLATLAGLMVPSQAAASDDDTTYVVRMKDSTVVYHGWVKDDGDWIYITPDSGPQAGQKIHKMKSKIEMPLEEEAGTVRDGRRRASVEAAQKQMSERGLTRVSPGKVVSNDEIAFANRAKEMVKERESQRADVEEAKAAPSDGGQVSAPSVDGETIAARPGFLKQWGGHVFVGVIGLLLSAVVIKTMLV